MKIVSQGLLLLLLVAASQLAQAQTTVTKKVYVTVYLEDSFVNHWGSRNAHIKARDTFNAVRNYYQSFFGVELEFSTSESAAFVTTNMRSNAILDAMRKNLPPRRSLPSGFSDPTSNWLMVHRDIGNQGQAAGIGLLGKDYANMVISTFVRTIEGRVDSQIPAQEVPLPPCEPIPSRAQTKAETNKTAIHEMGHLLNATHPRNCSDSIMCAEFVVRCIVNPFGGTPIFTPIPTVSTKMDATNSAAIQAYVKRFLQITFPAGGRP